MPINADDIDPRTRKALGIPARRRPRITADEKRREAIAVLACIRHLSQGDRGRVLAFAALLNKV